MYDYAGVPPWTTSLYTPSHRYDGKYIKDLSDGFATYEEWQLWAASTFDSLLAIPSPCRLDIDYHFQSADSDSVYIGFDLVVEDSMDFNTTLRVGVTEYQYPAIPTGRWRHIFRDWLKDDLPDSVGWSLGPMYPGQSLRFDLSYPLASYTPWKVSTFIFVQRNGTRKMQQSWEAHPDDAPSAGIADGGESVKLGRNAPNPFKQSTSISYSLANSGQVRLGVYTLTGRLVTELVNESVASGHHTATWDGRDRYGNDVAAGVYYFILETGDARQVGKMIRLR
ncbi:MAG: FlgD immunoglobulin-like domain containing protein [bacterium]